MEGLTNQQVFDLIRFIAKKEVNGDISPNEFNLLLPVCSTELYDQILSLYEKDDFATATLSRFKVYMGNNTPQLAIDTYGKATFPTDYKKYSGSIYKQIINNVTYLRKVDELTDEEYTTRLASYITIPTKNNPVVNIRDEYFQFYPYNLVSVDLMYLRVPTIPIYDFYYDANGNMIFMPTNTTHILATGDIYSDGITTSGTVTSKNVDLDWEIEEQIKIINLLLSKIGISTKENDVFQYAELMKKEGK